MTSQLQSENFTRALCLQVFLLVFFFLFCATEVKSEDIQFQANITQPLFKDFSKELGAVLSYKAFVPAEPLGIFGLDAGVEITAADINEKEEYWKRATQNSDAPSLIPLPKAYAKKGIVDKLDVGIMLSKLPDSNISLLGGEVKYAIREGSLTTSAIALRGTYTFLEGVDQLDLSTYGLDLSISKGILNMTPFAGFGAVYVTSKPKNLPIGLSLDKENTTLMRYFVGTRLTLLSLNITADIEYMEIPMYNLKAGYIF